MKSFSTPIIMAALLAGCGSDRKFTPEDIKKDEPGKFYNGYAACLSNSVATILWPEDATYDKTVDICRGIAAPNAGCASKLGIVADAVATRSANLPMVNAARDACETGREVGPVYTKATPSWGDETEQDFYDGADGEALRLESAARSKHRTNFTRQTLPDIRRCYESADANSCYAVLTAKTTYDGDGDGIYNDPARGYLLDEYGCVFLVKSIIQRQALNNQPGFVLVGGSAHYESRWTDEGVETGLFYGIGSKERAADAARCNLELRKSGLPELR